MTPALYEACRQAVHLITPQGQILRGGRAVLLALELCSLWPGLMRLAQKPPLIWLVEGGYHLIANNRLFFARFFFTQADGSAVMAPRLKRRLKLTGGLALLGMVVWLWCKD